MLLERLDAVAPRGRTGDARTDRDHLQEAERDERGELTVRMGLLYARGLRQVHGAEFSGADQAHADGMVVGSALLELAVEVHGLTTG